MGTQQIGQAFGNLGIGGDRVEVQETGVYMSPDRQVSKRYTAGTLIPVQEARLLGIVPAAAAPPVAEVDLLTDAELGEQYARCLTAAGYAIYRVDDTELVDGDAADFDPGEFFAESLRAAGYSLAKGDPAPEDVDPMSDDEQRRQELTERRAAAKAAKEAENKADEKPDNKVDEKPEDK